jgi:hypothetical protein
LLPNATHWLQLANPKGLAEGLDIFLSRHPIRQTSEAANNRILTSQEENFYYSSAKLLPYTALNLLNINA